MDFAIRPARPEDIPDLSRLLLSAAGGIVDAVYEGLIPGLPTNEIVERRFHRSGTTGSYENCWVATQGEQIAGKLHAYPLDDGAMDPADTLIPEARFAVFEPFDRIDPPATGSFYINVVATFPEFEGQGLGKLLVALGRDEAARRGYSQLSLVVFEQNERAFGLYQHLGFREVARHPAVPHPSIRYGGDLLMMMRPV